MGLLSPGTLFGHKDSLFARQVGAEEIGFGPLVPDPEGILNLPQGFSYKIISRWQETMSDGFLVPGNADGMAAFTGPDGLTVVLRNHGFAFEVEVRTKQGIQRPRPLKALGRFIHEGVAVLPEKNVIYQTEDQSDSMFYRFLPEKPGDLTNGKLQCLALVGKPGFDTRNWREQKLLEGEKAPVEWIDLEDVDTKKNDLRLQGFQKGGARFANAEGIAYGGGAVYFDCIFGGPNKAGQIWRYFPSPHEGTDQEKQEPAQLELFLEPNNKRLLYNPDQMTISPWGDLFICEDNPQRKFLWGITIRGQFYLFAMNVKDDSELAGVCFSPDRTTMFLNMQNIGLTFAITGPWITG